jgi:DNA-binding CsgD family transcriptional regulator
MPTSSASTNSKRDGRFNPASASLTSEFLKLEYSEKKRSAPDIAAQLGLHQTTVLRALRKAQIIIRPTKEASALSNSKVMVTSELVSQIRKLSAQGSSDAEIGEQIGLSGSRIQQLRTEHKIKGRSAAEGLRKKYGHAPLALQRDELYQLYEVEGFSINELCSKFSCTKRFIRSKLDQFQIPRRDVQEASLLANGNKSFAALDNKELVRMYVELGMCMQDIADLFKISHHPVKKRLVKEGVELRERPDWVRLGRMKTGNTKHLTEETLQERYVRLQHSVRRISIVFGVDPKTVKSYLSRYGIEVRTREAARALMHEGAGQSVYLKAATSLDSTIQFKDSKMSRHDAVADESAVSADEVAARRDDLNNLTEGMIHLKSKHPLRYHLIQRIFGFDNAACSASDLAKELKMSLGDVESEIKLGLEEIKSHLD